MHKARVAVFIAAVALSLGCAVTDYPIITDTRGDFTGIIRTGHPAYIVPTSQVATIYPDGSDELFSMVSQNQYGDQSIQTFNNFDPTASVLLMDQTYCDWRYSGCEITRAWNPANPVMDDSYDYEFFPDCSGARSLSLLVSDIARVGECGDSFWNHKQQLFAEFANLATTTWRGGTAYLVPIDSSNTSITLTTSSATATVPLFGSFTAFLNDKNQMMFPMTPNMRQELRWLSSFAAANGSKVNAAITYGSLHGNVRLALATDGLDFNTNRF